MDKIWSSDVRKHLMVTQTGNTESQTRKISVSRLGAEHGVLITTVPGSVYEPVKYLAVCISRLE